MSDELVTWVEIDLRVCSRRFGVAPCTAALSLGTPRKCVNTFLTCADTDNYDAETVTITLTQKGQTGLPFVGRHFPCLISVDESEQTVNIAGSDSKADALGRRASITVRASDFVYDDRFLDPYWDERISGAAQFNGVGYVPQGTLWQRLRARDPYFAGYPLRRYRGRVVDGAIVTDEVLHYIVTDFTPSKGGAVWQGVDVLDLASNDRALAPKPSGGRLLADIDATATSLTLTPEGVGAEYASAGYVTIGREIIRYHTRTGDTLGSLVRGRFNTQAAAHTGFAAVQEAWQFEGPAYQGLNVLLTEFAPVPSSWVPLDDWQAEAEVWFPVQVQVIVTKPTPVNKLIGELSILGFSLFTDLAAQKIRFRANRPLFPNERDTAPIITDDDVIGQAEYEGRDNERLTRVEFRSVQIDPTQELADSNFVQQQFTIAADKEDPRAHGDIRYRLEKTRWLNQGANATIRILAQRYLRRFSTAPERVRVVVKRRKFGGLKLTDVVNLNLRTLPAPYGFQEPKAYQIRRRKSVNAGEIMLELQRFDYSGTFGFWAPNDAPDYGDATEEEKDRMAFWGPNTGDTFTDGRPLYKYA
jgi:hypothetical protein